MAGPRIPDRIRSLTPYKPGRPIEEVERELGIQIPDESLAGIQTVKDLLELVEKRQALASA